MLNPKLHLHQLKSDYSTLRDLMARTGKVPDEEDLLNALWSIRMDTKRAKNPQRSARPRTVQDYKRSRDFRERMGLKPQGSRTQQTLNVGDPEDPITVAIPAGTGDSFRKLKLALSYDPQTLDEVMAASEAYERRKQVAPERVMNDIIQRHTHRATNKGVPFVPGDVLRERKRYKEAKIDDILSQVAGMDVSSLGGEKAGKFLDYLMRQLAERYTGEY